MDALLCPVGRAEIIEEVLDAETTEAGVIDAAEADELKGMGGELACNL